MEMYPKLALHYLDFVPTEVALIFFLQTYACILCFFLSNTIEGQLISTGAFEISFNGKPYSNFISCNDQTVLENVVKLLRIDSKRQRWDVQQ